MHHMKHMKQMTWAIVAIGILLAGSIFPAEARGGRGSGFHGGGGRSHAGSFRGGHGFHGSRFHGGTRVFIGAGVGWWGPGYWGAPYPYYSAPPVVIEPAPTTYIQQEPAPPAQAYWYYCANAGAYYPYVKDCPGGWMQVVPAPNPPSP